MSFRGVSKGSVAGEADREPVSHTSLMIAVVVFVFVVFATPAFSYIEKRNTIPAERAVATKILTLK